LKATDVLKPLDAIDGPRTWCEMRPLKTTNAPGFGNTDAATRVLLES